MLKENPIASFRYCPRCGCAEVTTPQGGRSLHCPQCGLSYYHNVAAAVAGIVLDRQGNLLSVRRARDPERGTLDLPGGFVDPNETVEQAMLRELEEETGLQAESLRYLWSIPNIYPYSGIDVYTADMVFLIYVESFDPAVACDDAAELVITPLAQIRPEDYGLISIRQTMERWSLQWREILDSTISE